MGKKKATNPKRKRKRLLMAVDLFVESRRASYEHVTKMAGLREVSEWVRRVLDAEAERLSQDSD